MPKTLSLQNPIHTSTKSARPAPSSRPTARDGKLPRPRVATRALRPPAVPLLTLDPSFSLWSMSDRLTDEFPKHWTGVNQSLTGMARIDGKSFRCIGPQPEDIPAARQVRLEVLPTRTRYTFRAAGVEILLTFMTPSLPSNPHTLSWPVGYVTFDLRATDGQPHAVQLYFDVCAEFVVDSPDQRIVGSRLNCGGATALSFGTASQNILASAGDDRRIDWGYLYLIIRDTPGQPRADTCIAPKQDVQENFADTGDIANCDDLNMPRAVADGWPALIARWEFRLDPGVTARRDAVLVYDDLFSIEYLHRKLRPYWNRANMGAATLIQAALAEEAALENKCAAFDTQLMADLTLVGGPEFAQLGALAYRQTLAGHKLCADIDGTPLYFSKEMFSNGCIATVDVTYPSAPFFLLFNPILLEAQLTPIFQYASTPRWRFQYAPHDLGTYPLANGQVYGGGEKSDKLQMPVEECGNMILMTAALTRGHGHLDYVRKWWPLLSQWAEFLCEKGFDPERQLCTDDFAGRLAHNANLSIKAILAIGAYADLCNRLGLSDDARRFRAAAEQMVQAWTSAARDTNGRASADGRAPDRLSDNGHYRLAFNRPGTWSMKYNLIWDQLLDLRLFPPEVVKAELAFYLKHQQKYGLPLDSRKKYAKLDWIGWVASMGTRKDFDALMKPVYRWVHETPTRVPLADHYWADSGDQVVHWKERNIGFQGRPVVGAIFVALLKNEEMWRKYRGAAQAESTAHHLQTP